MHPKVLPQLQRRAAAITDGPIDWGTGEIIAFGSLLLDGRPVRLAGQDSPPRHVRAAVRHDHRPAQRRRVDAAANLSEDQAKFYVYDSLLSEYAALGFEYGYSVARPEALVLWEAQFGDFVNGAQTIIDEYISAGETKWGQQSGVVLLLPHGYEGQGPDHSSARIERFLTMAADDAFVVAQPSTPACYFHLLRQHSLGEEHRPLIVFTPKSMLKRKEAASQPEDFTERHLPAGHPRRRGRHRRGREGPAVLAAGSPGTCWPSARSVRATSPTRRSCGSSSSTRARSRSSRPSWPSTRSSRRSAGSRTSPPTWAPWPHMALHLTRDLAGTPFYRVSRPESSAPSVGQHSPPRGGAEGAPARRPSADRWAQMYFTDRGIEELEKRRGDEEVTLAWVADRLQRVRRHAPRVRDGRRAAGHLAGPARRRGRRVTAWP